MKPETARDLLIPYLDGELDPQTTTLLEKHLAGDAALRTELEQLRVLFADIGGAEQIQPDVSLRERFQAMLAEAAAAAAREPAGRAGRPRLLAFPALVRAGAAAALVLCGLGAGWWLAHRGAPDGGAALASADEVADLRHEVNTLRGLLFPSALASGSASFRLRTMSLAAEVEEPGPEVVDALFATLDEDENANVRLAALEALARFQDQTGIRRRLTESLGRQKDPFVQIALVGVLATAGGPDAHAAIEELLYRPDVAPVVKAQAQQTITNL